jgi:hypothetical protein
MSAYHEVKPLAVSDGYQMLVKRRAARSYLSFREGAFFVLALKKTSFLLSVRFCELAYRLLSKNKSYM